MKNPESKFKERVMKDLTKLSHCWVLKTQERARRGVPDLIICFCGLFIAIELKKDSSPATALQKYTIDEIRKAHGVSFVTYPDAWNQHFETIKSLEH